MCDYSLHAIKNRLAVEGEQLFIHKFPTGSKGLASVADYWARSPRGVIRLLSFLGVVGKVSLDLPACCIPPGAKLRLSGIPSGFRERYDVNEVEEVTFIQLTAKPFRYRDAFRFQNGEEILIQKFSEGLRVEVLALELEERAGAVAEKAVERRMSANA
jgi:hypothetical protein